MKTEITDACGITMAGPDEPALAAAKARDVDGVVEEARSEAYLRYCDDVRAAGRHPFNFEEWSLKREPGSVTVRDLGTTVRQREKRELALGASVGTVDPSQAGILPTGRITVSNEMVMRAQTELVRHENPLGAGAIRTMLEAALRG